MSTLKTKALLPKWGSFNRPSSPQKITKTALLLLVDYVGVLSRILFVQ